MLEKQLALYRNELASEPTQALSPEEQGQLTENAQHIERIKQQLLELSASKAEVNLTKKKICPLSQRRRRKKKRKDQEKRTPC